jgi:hypothetical protein
MTSTDRFMAHVGYVCRSHTEGFTVGMVECRLHLYENQQILVTGCVRK